MEVYGLRINHATHATHMSLPTPLSFRISVSLVLLLSVIGIFLIPSSVSATEEKPVNFAGDDVRWLPDEKVTANGNVKVQYLDYTVSAQSAEADLQTNIAIFKGKVTFSTKGQNVQGENLKLNLKTKEWTLENADSKIDPQVFKGMTKGPTFVHGLELSGTSTDEVTITSGTLTTCDKEHPHYSFKAHDIEVYPGSRVVAHKVSIFALDKRLFTIPVLVIPIKAMNHNLVPQVGSSVQEGMFIKSAVPYMANATAQGYLKLDLIQKKGIGVGLDQTYKVGTSQGQASLYFLHDNQAGGNNLTGNLQHHQKLGLLDMNFTTNYHQNSYQYYSTTTSRDWLLALKYGNQAASSALNLQNSTTGGYGTYSNSTYSFRHMRQFNQQFSGVFSLDMRTSDSSGSSSTSTRTLDSAIELREKAKKFDISLTANKQTDLSNSTSASIYGGVDRLPEITIDTDTYRLGKSLLGLNSRFSIVAGKYFERPAGTDKGRLLLQWDLLDKPISLGDMSTLSINGGVRQAYYASDMAQYVLKTGATLTTNFGDNMKSRIQYNYQRPEGFSPFQFDYTGKYNYLRSVIDYQQAKRLKWSLSTGYDIYSTYAHWQDMALHLTTHPNSTYAYSVGAGYNLNTSKWQTLLLQFQVAHPDHLTLDMGNRYDTQNHSLQTRGRIDWHLNKRWRMEGISSWNGDLKRIDYQSFRITRDLHCVEASITYTDESGIITNKGFSFQLRIKALPFIDRFGINQSGQQVDTSMGEYFY